MKEHSIVEGNRIQKAWVINPDKLSEPWHCPTEVYYAESAGKAKNMALRDLDGLFDKWSLKPFGFLNAPIKRAKKLDKYSVDGQTKTLASIEYSLKRKNRDAEIDKIVSDNPNGMAYILKGGYYYRPDNCGYTEFISMAGVYTVQDASRSVKSSDLGDYMRLVLIDTQKHNDMINERITDLQTRIIPSNPTHQ